MLGGRVWGTTKRKKKCEKTQEWTAESETGGLAGLLVKIYMGVVMSGDKYKASGCSRWQWVERSVGCAACKNDNQRVKMSSPLSRFLEVKTLDFWKKRIHARSPWSLCDRVSLLVISSPDTRRWWPPPPSCWPPLSDHHLLATSTCSNAVHAQCHWLPCTRNSRPSPVVCLKTKHFRSIDGMIPPHECIHTCIYVIDRDRCEFETLPANTFGVIALAHCTALEDPS